MKIGIKTDREVEIEKTQAFPGEIKVNDKLGLEGELTDAQMKLRIEIKNPESKNTTLFFWPGRGI